MKRAGKEHDAVKWHPVQLSSVDLEFIAQRDYAIAEIARWFKVKK